jgi:hypothetical protein
MTTRKIPADNFDMMRKTHAPAIQQSANPPRVNVAKHVITRQQNDPLIPRLTVGIRDLTVPHTKAMKARGR